MKAFFIKRKGGEELIGTSSFRTIVEAAAQVFERPRRADQGINALSLGTALSSAIEAGASKDETEAAFKLGETIGLKLLGRKDVKLKERPELVVRDATE